MVTAQTPTCSGLEPGTPALGPAPAGGEKPNPSVSNTALAQSSPPQGTKARGGHQDQVPGFWLG